MKLYRAIQLCFMFHIAFCAGNMHSVSINYDGTSLFYATDDGYNYHEIIKTADMNEVIINKKKHVSKRMSMMLKDIVEEVKRNRFIKSDGWTVASEEDNVNEYENQALDASPHEEPDHHEESDDHHSDDHHSDDHDHGLLEYSYLAGFFCILCIILGIELIREHLEEFAVSHRFFKKALLCLYSELTTVGIMGLIVLLFSDQFLGHLQKELFELIHFTFTFTTIMNACFSCIICFCVRKFFFTSWLEIEQMEETKFSEIEREYQQKKAKITRLSFLNPFFYCRYRSLLSKVKYKEMIRDFADVNDLPKGFHVSTYINACVMNVFMDLVQINLELWLYILSADVFINNLYLFVDYWMSGELNKNYATAILLIIVAVCVTVFLFIVLFHMKRIISSNIIHYKEEDCRQLDQFWLGRPHLIPETLKRLQMILSILIAMIVVGSIFNAGYFYDSYRTWIFSSILFTVFLYTFLSVYIIPHYALCTCLGQLVKPRILNECLAKFYLQEKLREVKVKRSNDSFDTNANASSVLEDENSDLFSSKLRKCFLSHLFHLLDVFLTLLCCFLVSRRVEAHLMHFGVLIDEAFEILYPNAKNTFIFETVLLFLLTLMSASSLAVFFSVRYQKQKFMVYCFASILDLILSYTCLLLLLFSEVQRNGDTFEERSENDGLGWIEPFTIFIFLRLYRFDFGEFLCNRFTQMKETKSHSISKKKENPSVTQQKSIAEKSVILIDAKHNHDEHEHKHEEEEFDLHQTVTLWKIATGLFPNVASKYGFFSGEMLMTMLGIHVCEKKDGDQKNSNDNDNETSELRHQNEFHQNSLNDENKAESSPLLVD